MVWFGALTALASLAIGSYELRVARLTGSQLVRNDGREWLLDAAFSLVTLLGFAALFVLPEPLRALWARYADSVLVMVLALIFMPLPLSVLRRSAAELLHMASEDAAITGRVEAEMRAVRSEHDIRSHSTHVARIGRSHLVEVNIVVGPRFALQTVAEQDALRARIWTAVGLPIHVAWLTISVTEDPRWA